MREIGALLVLALALFGCGSSAGGTALPSYKTAVAGAEGLSGQLEVTVGAPVASVTRTASTESEASAVLNIEGGPVTLTGTYNSATKQLSLTGDGYAFTGETGDDGELSGSYQNESNEGIFAGFDSSVNTVLVYCGTYDVNNCTGDYCTGIWDITTSSAGLSSGTYHGNDGNSGILWGTFEGDTLTGQDDFGSEFTGTVSNGVITGTWTLELENETVDGDFEASTAACPE